MTLGIATLRITVENASLSITYAERRAQSGSSECNYVDCH